jgi:hypothetical protein
MDIPARIVVRRQMLAHFQDCKHAAHIDVAKRSLAATHGNTVVRHWHAHACHVAHTGLAHRHIRGQEALDLCIEIPRLHPNHIGNVMAHLIHGVVSHMAVQRPVSWGVGDELEGARAADLHQNGCLYLLGRRRDGSAIRLRDGELIPV